MAELKETFLRLAGLVSEVQDEWTPADEAREREEYRYELMGLVNDMEKDAYGVRLRRDLRQKTVEELEAEVDALEKYVKDAIAAEREDLSWEMKRAEQADADLELGDELAYRSAEEEAQEKKPPGGTYGRKHFDEAVSARGKKKMKLTKSRLRQIIREEKSSINEAEGAVPNLQEIEDAVITVVVLRLRDIAESLEEGAGATVSILDEFWSTGGTDLALDLDSDSLRIDLADVVDFLKMVGWSEEQIRDGLDRIG